MLNVNFRNFNYSKDLEYMYLYMMKEENQILFSHSFQIHNLPMFEQWIANKFARNEYHDFFMIENKNGDTIGFTFSYEFFPHDRHCKYTLCLYEKYQSVGYGAIAGVKMMDYLFTKYPLKRIYISVFDYNKQSIQNNMKGGFKEVGVLPDYRFWGGEYFSLHLLTISRTEFYNKNKKIIERVK